MTTIAQGRPPIPMDAGAFEAFVRAHHPPMRGLARALAASEAEADEAVREAWRDVIGGLAGFRGDVPPRRWTLGLVADRVAARRGAPGRTRPAPPGRDAGADPVRGLLSEAIDGLPQDQRVVVRLRDVEGWSPGEVSDVLGMPADRQRALLHRARTTLHGVLYGAPGIEGR
jgi:RNA polymerase sigma-70 factor, ECF subfamily